LSTNPLQDITLTRRAFLRNTALATVGLGLAAAGAGAYARLLEPHWLDLERIQVPLSRLPRSLDGFTIAHISDLHVGPHMGAEELALAVEAVRTVHPQLVVISGDFVSRGDQWQRLELLAPLADLTADLGVHAVLGNHDHWTDATWIATTVDSLGINVMSNAAEQLSDSGQGLWLVGLDDIWVGAGDLAKGLVGVPDESCKVLLVHEPDFADKAARHGIDLQLSGHSHGGQVRLPLIGALLLPQWGTKYPIGLRRVLDGWVYTNRGLGVVSPAFRFNCRPEITQITLVRA
jgi:predicted MPP superfamily phosphohydrolase